MSWLSLPSLLSCCLPHTKKENTNHHHHNAGMNKEDLEMRGVSVHYLNTTFKDEAYNYEGYDGNSQGVDKKIYELENLKEQPGFIRCKGIDQICPRDGKQGTAFVDYLNGEDNVGRATAMLSYGWANTVSEIADVTSAYCDNQKLDPKKTYVWICCLCINQHRVADDIKNGIDVPFETFQQTFQSRVQGIGNIVCLLSPWDEAIYLTRVWCIFEFFTANTSDDCKAFIEMPRATRDNFKSYLLSEKNPNHVQSKIFRVLGNTSIQDAKASVPADKENIMKVIVEGLTGGVAELDKKVNELLRKWILHFLKSIFHEIKKEFELKTQAQQGNVASSYHVGLKNLTAIFTHNGRDLAAALETATWWHEELCLPHFGTEGLTSNSLAALSSIYMYQQNFEKAIEYRKKTLAIDEKEYGTNHLNTATTYYNLGSTYYNKNDLDEAMEYYNKACAILAVQRGPEHEDTARAYSAIGSVHVVKNELDEALSVLIKAMKIQEKLAQSNNGIKPLLATTYNNMAGVYLLKGDAKKVLEYSLKALDIREKIFGPDHPHTKLSYQNIMITYEKLGNTEKANEYKLKM